MGIAVTTGEHDYTLDSKNRLVVPPSYREALVRENGTHFWLTTALGDDACLWFFLPSQWEKLLEDFNEQTKTVKDKTQVRKLRSQIFGKAAPSAPDEQGRILVPHNLKEFAELKKDIKFVGMGNKAEIWDETKYAKFESSAHAAMTKLAKELDL
ncbi:MAG: division/cell wall cluster transcriptional repressor MraZ [Elusimicrobia bacterium]|nr:MAG: division/cell wall cluster transcriptional repressor MraZ [Elusimicrobiota bacterium]